MKTFTCIIVEDEPLAQSVMENFIRKTNFLELIKTCNNAFEAMTLLAATPVDIAFIDINMPKLSGLGLLKAMPNLQTKVIFTTAYSEYAVDGYEHNIVDFLLKPILYDRFLKAVFKATRSLEQVNQNTKHEDDKKHYFKADRKIHIVKESEIHFIKSMGNYIQVFTGAKNLMIHSSMNDVINELSPSKFVRVHKSYIVAIDKIESADNNEITIEGQTIPIGETFRNNLSFLKH